MSLAVCFLFGFWSFYVLLLFLLFWALFTLHNTNILFFTTILPVGARAPSALVPTCSFALLAHLSPLELPVSPSPSQSPIHSPSSSVCCHGLSIDVNDVLGTKRGLGFFFLDFILWFRSCKYLYTSKKKNYGSFATEPTSANLLVTTIQTKWKFLNRTPTISHSERKERKNEP